VEAGKKYPVARIGAKLPNGLVIKKSAIRSVESSGMLCSETELGLATESQGLLTLSDEATIGTSFKDYLGFDDVVLEIGITPNRGDCLSQWGLAIEIAALFGLSFKPQTHALKSSSKNPLKVTIQSPHCYRYMGAVITGIKVAPSHQVIARRLESLGIRAINNVVDATNYIMLLTGHPLHAFDARTVHDFNIKVQPSTGNEKFITLDGKQRELLADDLLICDDQKYLALAGIMGGENSEVKNDTTDLILEAASFEAVSIRKTAKRLGIISESSYRFERGVAADTLDGAMNQLIALILQMAGGELVGQPIDVYPQPQKRKSIQLTTKRLSDYIGLSWNDSEVSSIFENLGFEVQNVSGGWNVAVPQRRFDLSIEEDLIEEIARFKGLENIESELPRRPMQLVRVSKEEELCRLVKSHLVSKGYSELIHYSFVNEADLKIFGIDTDKLYKLANPLSEELAVMRPTLLVSLIKTYVSNQARHASGARYFELRRVYKGNSETLMLGILVAGNRFDVNWKQIEQEASFFELKGLLFDLLSYGYLKARFTKDNLKPYLHPGQSVNVLLGADQIGEMGILHPGVLNHLEINDSIGYLEIEIPLLVKKWKDKESQTILLSDQPTNSRDLALKAPASLTFGQLESAILKKNIKQLISLSLFDIYEGDKIEKGTKSIALKLIYGDENKTLTDEEVNVMHFKLVGELEKELGVLLR
ncbi:MAG: hypothetical protein ACD_73C00807G0001, partial [uncultured bacterium]